jgi:anaerobic selenocysteine-containing dehydrogenase
VGCGLIVDVEDGIARRVRGDREHPANLGSLCRKGVLLPQALRTPDRLLSPRVRASRDEDFRDVGWDEALEFVADRLRCIIDRDGPEAVAFYGSGQLLTEDYYLLGKLAKGFIGTNNQDTNSRLCMTSAAAAMVLAFGQDGPPVAHADIDDADCFLILGANVADCHPVLFNRIRSRKAAAGEQVKVIVVDPRRTETATIADHYLPVRPGADVALLNAMLHVIVEHGLVDTSFIVGSTEGFGAVRSVVTGGEYAPENVASLCGLDPGSIREAALAYGRAAAAMSLWTMGANQSTSGVDKNLGLINLALATGNIGRPGAGPFSLTGQPNAMGGREAGGLSHTLPGHRLVANPEHRREMELFWGLPAGRISDRLGLTAMEMVDGLAEGSVKALWVMCTNPLASLPNLRRAREAALRAELVVVQDAYDATETGRYAHVLLPAAQWSEREGTMTNGERRVCLLEAAGDPPGEALPDWEILCRFARTMGFGEAFRYEDVSEVFAEFVGTTRGRGPDMTGLSHDRLRGTGGVQWPFPEGSDAPGSRTRPAGATRLYADGVYPTPSGRARFHPVSYRLPAEVADGEYPFVLLTGRVRDQWHTRTRTGKIASLNRSCPEPFLEIHPDDAAALGVQQDELVEVRSRRGGTRLPARLSTHIRPGTVFAPIHWGAMYGAQAVNDVTTPAFDPVSKEPELKYSAVRLARCSPGDASLPVPAG